MISQTDRIRSQLLLLRYRRGETEAFEELVHIWEKPLYYYIRRIVGSEEDAWDVSQNVWLQVVRKNKQLRDPEKLPGWLYQVSRNQALNHLRSKHGEEISLDQIDCFPEGTTESGFNFSVAEADTIHWGLDQLPLNQREVLTLHFLEEFSLKEIGEITGVPDGTVKSRLFHAKRALREILQQEGLGHE
ncbi:MAG: sigma-70 family RNA polymerase sigma factor [Candidatus Omnitrophica bacterium]|nr:sigma-70 family RNA polymerase sigma factor [Candidatus Omnitrophota bacterium]